MDEALVSTWMTGLTVACLVVLIAAALLIAILAAARRILRLAGEALQAVQQIKQNTNSIWELDRTNQVAEGILGQAESIVGHGAAVAETLHPSEDESNVA